MAFDSGTISFRPCVMLEEFPEDVLERFAAKAAPPLEHAGPEPQLGWVTGRGLLETTIDEESATCGGFLHLQLRNAIRKIPTSLLRAECRMAELVYIRENKDSVVPRKIRKQIKEDATERLLPRMPPQITGIPFAYDEPSKRLYIGATSDKQLDTFMAYFHQTLGFEPVPLTPEIIVVQQMDMDPADVPPLNFSSRLSDGDAIGTIGQNFLTWLWFYLDTNKGMLPKTQMGEFGILMDGPLVLVAEGPGAHESSIRKGTPLLSAEAQAALSVGKKLNRVKITLARGDEMWTCAVDGETFTFRSMKLPDGEALDPASVFEERMTNLYVFQTVFFELFKYYIRQVTDSNTRATLQKDIKTWVEGLPAK